MSTNLNALLDVSQQKSLKQIKADLHYFLIHELGECDYRNRALDVLRTIVLLFDKTGQRDIPRSYSAAVNGIHVQTVTSATNFLESIGAFTVVRRFKQVNKYTFKHLDVLKAVLGLTVDYYTRCARLFNSKLDIKSKLVSKCSKTDRFSLNFKPNKGSEGKEICFSPLSGVYVPLELRPLNNTIEVSREDRTCLAGVKYNHLFPSDADRHYRAVADRRIAEAKEASAEYMRDSKEEVSQAHFDKFLRMLSLNK